MRIFIDGVEAALASRVNLPLYNFSALRGVAGWREGTQVDVDVVATEEIRALFGHYEELYRTQGFNDSYHSARIEQEGVVVYSGVAAIAGVGYRGSKVVYRLRIRVGGAEWADMAALTRLSDTAIEEEWTMSLSDIEESWSSDSVVKMLPLHRDRYVTKADTGLSLPQQMLLPQDYHPFISIKAIIESIAEQSGYELCSNFLQTPLAQKLMLSGAYKRVEAEQAYATMGFKALRTKSTTATASAIGRVDAWVPATGSNLGVVVDTVSPNAVDENGVQCSEAYDVGGCFTFEKSAPTFRPKREINVAFDVYLRYTTDYKILSSTRLRGFDKLYIGNECYVEVGLQNPFRDLRNEVVAGATYRLYIFDYDSANSYMLTGYNGVVTSQISSIEFGQGFSGSTMLYCKVPGQSVYYAYTGDWALYGSYVEPEGRREVEVTVRTPYEHLTPTKPKVFKEIYIYGAEEGMTLTLHSGCSITPIFGGTPGYGDRVTFKDVAAHDISQAELLEAIAHLFNLCIYTHRPSKRLYIEPYDDFFGGDVVDWRDRQQGDDVEIEECVLDSFVATTLGYQPSDGATKRLMEESDAEFGAWSLLSDSYAAKQSVAVRRNPLFAATASMTEAVGVAPSAAVLVVGERDIVEEQEYVTPRVALYHGVEPLPEGEYWPMSYSKSGYPLVAFHSPEKGATLCFEDRDECFGLHSYYDNQLREMAERQRVTLDVRLLPIDYVALFDLDGSGATIRSRFRLQVGENSSLFRLEEIVAYDPERGVARCRFQRLMCD